MVITTPGENELMNDALAAFGQREQQRQDNMHTSQTPATPSLLSQPSKQTIDTLDLNSTTNLTGAELSQDANINNNNNHSSNNNPNNPSDLTKTHSSAQTITLAQLATSYPSSRNGSHAPEQNTEMEEDHDASNRVSTRSIEEHDAMMMVPSTSTPQILIRTSSGTPQMAHVPRITAQSGHGGTTNPPTHPPKPYILLQLTTTPCNIISEELIHHIMIQQQNEVDAQRGLYNKHNAYNNNNTMASQFNPPQHSVNISNNVSYLAALADNHNSMDNNNTNNNNHNNDSGPDKSADNNLVTTNTQAQLLDYRRFFLVPPNYYTTLFFNLSKDLTIMTPAQRRKLVVGQRRYQYVLTSVFTLTNNYRITSLPTQANISVNGNRTGDVNVNVHRVLNNNYSTTNGANSGNVGGFSSNLNLNHSLNNIILSGAHDTVHLTSLFSFSTSAQPMRLKVDYTGTYHHYQDDTQSQQQQQSVALQSVDNPQKNDLTNPPTTNHNTIMTLQTPSTHLNTTAVPTSSPTMMMSTIGSINAATHVNNTQAPALSMVSNQTTATTQTIINNRVIQVRGAPAPVSNIVPLPTTTSAGILLPTKNPTMTTSTTLGSPKLDYEPSITNNPTLSTMPTLIPDTSSQSKDKITVRPRSASTQHSGSTLLTSIGTIGGQNQMKLRPGSVSSQHDVNNASQTTQGSREWLLQRQQQQFQLLRQYLPDYSSHHHDHHHNNQRHHTTSAQRPAQAQHTSCGITISPQQFFFLQYTQQHIPHNIPLDISSTTPLPASQTLLSPTPFSPTVNTSVGGVINYPSFLLSPKTWDNSRIGQYFMGVNSDTMSNTYQQTNTACSQRLSNHIVSLPLLEHQFTTPSTLILSTTPMQENSLLHQQHTYDLNIVETGVMKLIKSNILFNYYNFLSLYNFYHDTSGHSNSSAHHKSKRNRFDYNHFTRGDEDDDDDDDDIEEDAEMSETRSTKLTQSRYYQALDEDHPLSTTRTPPYAEPSGIPARPDYSNSNPIVNSSKNIVEERGQFGHDEDHHTAESSSDDSVDSVEQSSVIASHNKQHATTNHNNDNTNLAKILADFENTPNDYLISSLINTTQFTLPFIYNYTNNHSLQLTTTNKSIMKQHNTTFINIYYPYDYNTLYQSYSSTTPQQNNSSQQLGSSQTDYILHATDGTPLLFGANYRLGVGGDYNDALNHTNALTGGDITTTSSSSSSSSSSSTTTTPSPSSPDGMQLNTNTHDKEEEQLMNEYISLIEEQYQSYLYDPTADHNQNSQVYHQNNSWANSMNTTLYQEYANIQHYLFSRTFFSNTTRFLPWMTILHSPIQLGAVLNIYNIDPVLMNLFTSSLHTEFSANNNTNSLTGMNDMVSFQSTMGTPLATAGLNTTTSSTTRVKQQRSTTDAEADESRVSFSRAECNSQQFDRVKRMAYLQYANSYYNTIINEKSGNLGMLLSQTTIQQHNKHLLSYTNSQQQHRLLITPVTYIKALTASNFTFLERPVLIVTFNMNSVILQCSFWGTQNWKRTHFVDVESLKISVPPINKLQHQVWTFSQLINFFKDRMISIALTNVSSSLKHFLKGKFVGWGSGDSDELDDVDATMTTISESSTTTTNSSALEYKP